jgi:hypothetical protein
MLILPWVLVFSQAIDMGETCIDVVIIMSGRINPITINIDMDTGIIFFVINMIVGIPNPTNAPIDL